MQPEIAITLILVILVVTIFVVIKYPSIGPQASSTGFLLNLLISIFTKKTDSN
jgi:hypothetical protein